LKPSVRAVPSEPQKRLKAWRLAEAILRPAPKLPPDEWARANRVYAETSGLPGPRDPSITPYIVPVERAVHAGGHKRVVMVCGAQMGKSLALDTPLPTPQGWTTMGEVQPGDVLFDERGAPCNVTVVNPVQHGRTCYRVIFDDGEEIIADADHLWTVTTDRWARDGGRRQETLTTGQMIERGVHLHNGAARFAIPVAGALQLPEVDLLIDPYILGAWLGDGNSRSSRITVGREDLDTMTSLLEAHGACCHPRWYGTKTSGAWDVKIALAGQEDRSPDCLSRRLGKLNLLKNKHIPTLYLRASAAQRLALLRGLMDTDGGVYKGKAEFCSKYEALALQFFDLAVSLGFKPRLRSRISSKYKTPFYCVNFLAYKERSPFLLPRKRAALGSVHHARSRPYLAELRYIRDIVPVSSVPVRCIGVESPSHLYLAGYRMVPTHNTDGLLDIMGARLDQRPAPILYVGPIRDFLTDQFEPRLMNLLDEAETLSAKVVRGRRMKKTLKVVAGVPVRLAHAGSSAALKSSPAALALVDEYDEMLANVKGQGDPLGLVEARGETYADFVTAITSTPSRGLIETEHDPKSGLTFWKPADPEAVESAIWKLWQSGTRHHFCWPCLHCDKYFVPRFEQMRWPENATPAEAARSAQLQCPHCGGLHTDDDKQEMNSRGLYVAPGQWVEDGEVQGEPPENATVSFWASGLASPFVTWGTRVERYVRALASGDPDQVQTALNAGFGECFTPTSGRDALDWQEILERREPYRMKELPGGVLRLAMAVDVQKLSLYYVIRGFGARGRSWLIDRCQLFGPTDDDEVWNALADLMLSPIAGLQIERVFIDSGFRPNKPDAGDEHKVYEFTRRYPWLVSPTKGRATMSPPYRVSKIEVTAKGRKASYSINLVWLSTDFFKSLLVSRIRTPLEQPGSFVVPEDIDEDYARQLVSEARVVDGASGKPQWVQKSRANHYLDCEALAMAIGYSLNVQRIPDGVVREGSDTGAETLDGGDVEPAPAQTAAVMATAAMPDLRSRFAGLSSRLNR